MQQQQQQQQKQLPLSKRLKTDRAESKQSRLAGALHGGGGAYSFGSLIAGYLPTSGKPSQNPLYAVSKSTRQHSLKSETSLNLQSNSQWNIIVHMCIPLLPLNSLLRLNLSNNQIAKKECGFLAENFLQHLPHLQELNLSHNRIDDEGCGVLASCKTSLTELRVLNISSNSITVEGCAALAALLLELHQLEKLDLSNNEIGDGGCWALVTGNALGSLRQLQELHLGFANIGVEGCVALATALPQLHNLKVISIKNNNFISDEGCRILFAEPVISSLTQLEELELRTIGMRVDGCHALANVLHHLPNLNVLDLTANLIGDVGNIELARNLPHLTKLRKLVLTDTNMTDEGCHVLFEVLPDLKELRLLNLSYNYLTRASCDVLTTVLPRLEKLRAFNIRWNKIVNCPELDTLVRHSMKKRKNFLR